MKLRIFNMLALRAFRGLGNIIGCRTLPSRQLHCSSCQKTLIFERDYELPDGPLNAANLEKKNHIYRVVSIETGPTELEIILTKDSLEHGVAGEVLSVETEVGRQLIKNFEAVYASPENLAEIASSFTKKSGQTISGRRMLLWLRTREYLTCAMREDVEWTLTPGMVARAFLRYHKLVVPESSLKLPDYPITSSDPESWKEHDIGITVNSVDTVAMKMVVVPWTKK